MKRTFYVTVLSEFAVFVTRRVSGCNAEKLLVFHGQILRNKNLFLLFSRLEFHFFQTKKLDVSVIKTSVSWERTDVSVCMDGRFGQQRQVFHPRRTVVTECKNRRFLNNDGNLSVTKKDGQG